MTRIFSLLLVVLAAPPEGEPVPAPAAAAQRGGYFLSARFAEGRDVPSVGEAVSEMRGGALAFSPRDAPPPGFLLGHSSSIELAMAFVARWIFARAVGEAPAGLAREIPAPIPGGPAVGEQPLHLLTLTVTGSTPDGDLRDIVWPSFAGAIVPPELPWKAAGLMARRAPLFAAPSPTLPPASEAHAQATREGGLYALGTLDRCQGSGGERRCLRYDQVVSRDGDDFRGGYLPAYTVAIHESWTPAADILPRAQLRPYALSGNTAHFVVFGRGLDGVLRQAAVTLPAAAGGFPEASLSLVGERVVVMGGGTSVSLTLDERFGARPEAP